MVWSRIGEEITCTGEEAKEEQERLVVKFVLFASCMDGRRWGTRVGVLGGIAGLYVLV